MLTASRFLAFEDFRFSVPMRELLRVGTEGSTTPIPLGSRAAELLLFFVQRPGELVTKSEILDAVWPNVTVDEANLRVQISALRRALDANRSGASAIQTVPGRGFRFTLQVVEDLEAATRPPALGHVESGPRHENTTTPPIVSEVTAVPRSISTVVSPNQRGGRTRRWRLVGAVATVVLLCGSAAMVTWSAFFSESIADRGSAGSRFSADAVPLVTDETRQALADYPKLPDAKAIAIGRNGWGMTSGAGDIAAAKEAALQRCAAQSTFTRAETPGPCAIYAAGSDITWPKERLRLPWPADVHATALDMPFIAAELPTIPAGRQQAIERRYSAAANHKALAIGQERFYTAIGRSTQAEAVRLAIEDCADFVQAPCLLVAVDGALTVKLPKLHQVTQVFTLAADTTMPDPDKQRVAVIYQRGDWRALVRGGKGGWYAVAEAPSEMAAADQAMELCAASDRDCRIYAIGNFRVAEPN